MLGDREAEAQSLAHSRSSSSSSSSLQISRFSDRRRPYARRLSSAMLRGTSTTPNTWRSLPRRAWAAYLRQSERLMKSFWRLSLLQRIAVVVAILLGWVLIIFMVIYSSKFFEWLAPVAKSWREKPGGWIVVFLMIFCTAFPPLIGYSTANTVAGFVYGVWKGWLIAAVACTLGSLAAFVASRTVLSRHVHRMVGKDQRFVALGQVLRQEGLLYLTAIRFCPLPFSLSNGFLATIPSITPSSFALATAIASPKLLVHAFIGSRLAILAEKGDNMTPGDKAVNHISMFAFGSLGLAVGLLIYRRTMARAAELADDADVEAVEEGRDLRYEDTDATLLDPEDAAAVMSDDDVSLWEAQREHESGERYGDEGDERVAKKNAQSRG